MDELNHFLRPIIDELEVSWNQGIHISRTASSPVGRIVEAAIVLSLNDLPAARKVAGAAGHGSDFFCPVCPGHGRDNVYRTDFHNWNTHGVVELRQHAEASRAATTSRERDKIFKNHGVRWSELWRLPYWNPVRMLVVDSMHCILEGLVPYHCRNVLVLHANSHGTRIFLPLDSLQPRHPLSEIPR